MTTFVYRIGRESNAPKTQRDWLFIYCQPFVFSVNLQHLPNLHFCMSSTDAFWLSSLQFGRIMIRLGRLQLQSPQKSRPHSKNTPQLLDDLRPASNPPKRPHKPQENPVEETLFCPLQWGTSHAIATNTPHHSSGTVQYMPFVPILAGSLSSWQQGVRVSHVPDERAGHGAVVAATQ